MSRRRPLTATAKILLVAIGVAWLAIHHTGAARAGSVSSLQQQISSGKSSVSSLSGTIGSQSKRIATLGKGISSLRQKLAAEQALLNARLATLHRTQAQYRTEHKHLLKLEAYLKRAETLLSKQLVAQYESPQPDLVSVVLNSTSFKNLLEQLNFGQQIVKHNARVVSVVQASRRSVAAEAVRLGALEVKERKLTAGVLADRNRVAQAEIALVKRQTAIVHSRSANSAKLARARSRLVSLRTQLSQIEAAQRAASTPAPAPTPPTTSTPTTPTPTSTPTGGAQPVSSPPASSGSFTFPLPTSAASPPSTWSLDQGVDITAPGNTPEYAVCSGTIVLHGIGGFGPWAPVLHCDSPVGGYSYVYYGHAGPADQLAVGTHVSAGQVMSSIGPGIVGISSGPHLEIGFCDSSGSPLGGGTASTMLSLLHGAYGG